MPVKTETPRPPPGCVGSCSQTASSERMPPPPAILRGDSLEKSRHPATAGTSVLLALTSPCPFPMGRRSRWTAGPTRGLTVVDMIHLYIFIVHNAFL